MIKAAVIGAGVIGPYHARAYEEHPGVKLEGIFTKPADKYRLEQKLKDVNQFPASLRNVPVFTCREKMFAKTKPDLVSICVPTPYHIENAKYALSQGCHALIEKPIAETFGKAKDLVNEFNNQNLKVGVNLQLAQLRDIYTGTPYKILWESKGTPGVYGDPILDLAGHALSFLNYRKKPICIDAKKITPARRELIYQIGEEKIAVELGFVEREPLRQWFVGNDTYIYSPPSHINLKPEHRGGAHQGKYMTTVVKINANGKIELAYKGDPLDSSVKAFADAVIYNSKPPFSGEDALVNLEMTLDALEKLEK